MSFISTTAPQTANQEVADMYRRLQGSSAYLPNYAGIFSHRPALMAQIGQLMKCLMEPMEPRLWDLVNLAAARACNSSYCSLAFAHKIIARHFSEQELLEILNDSPSAPLGSNERAAMEYAALVARDASAMEQHHIDALRQHGYSDGKIFDITAAAAWRCFFARVPDALGALPDRALGQLREPLLDLLLVGRDIELDC